MAGYLRRRIRRSLALTVALTLASAIAVAGQAIPASLSGYTAEEVEAGVWRVDSDGIRDLARPLYQVPPRAGVVAGLDGSVWLTGPRELLKLGGESVALDRVRRPRGDDFATAAVGPDGRLLWTARGLHAWDGSAWTTLRDAPDRGFVVDVSAEPDGTVWAAWTQNRKTRVGRLDADGWTGVSGTVDTFGDSVHPFPGGVLLATGPGGEVWRHDGDAWSMERLPQGELRAVADGGDGSYWVRLGRERDDGEVAILARWDGDSWTVYKGHDVPWSGSALTGPGRHVVGVEGGVWFPARDPAAGLLEDCDGIAHFDTRVTAQFLRDHCVHDLDVAPDGGVWFIASRAGEPVDGELTDSGPIELFHIPA